MRIPDEMDPEYLAELRERCMERTGHDRRKADRLVRAVIKGWTEADESWRRGAA